MAVSLTLAKALVVEALNESTKGEAYGTISATKERFKSQEVTDAILAADARAVTAGLETPGWGHRRAFTTSGTVAHLGQVPDHVGPVMSVTVDGKGASVPGLPDPKAKIERDRANPQTLTLLERFFFIDDNDVLFHSGTTATVYYCTFTMTAACQSPDELLRAVVEGALAILFSKDGHKTGAATDAEQRFQLELRASGIGTGAMAQAR
jgi:hypothetical protein